MSPSLAITSSPFSSLGTPRGPCNHHDKMAGARAAAAVHTESELFFQKNRGLSARSCEVIQEPVTFIARAKHFLSSAAPIVCMPLRVCTTLLSVGMFAGYYVTAMTVTGLGALTGTLTGIGATIKAHITASTVKKSLKEYTVSHAQKVFKWLSFPYEHLPKTVKGYVFPAIAGAALFLLETAAIPVKRIPIGVYKNVWSQVYTATKPYKPVTDMSVQLFAATKRWILG